VLLAADQRAYAQLCQLITLARRRAAKGCYALGQADLEAGSITAGAVAAAPGRRGRRWASARRRAVAGRALPGRAWLAVELHRGAGDRGTAGTLLELARLCALPRWPQATCICTGAIAAGSRIC